MIDRLHMTAYASGKSQILLGGDGFMGGTIRCAKRGCEKVMTNKVCTCGNVTCYVAVYYKGKLWRYRRDTQGDILTYGKAGKLLNSIREQIDSKNFDPEARLDSKIVERRFENKWEVFVEEKEERVRGGELSPSYVRILRSYRNKYFDHLNGRDVRDISLEHLAAVKRGMTGCKIKTKQNMMNALITFFRWLLNEDGSVQKLPKFPVIEGDDSVPQGAIDRDSQDIALINIPLQFRDPIEFGMETGCRPGEVCALKVKDIEGNKAFICRTWSDYIVRETTKQKKKQYIPLSDRARQIACKNMEGKHVSDWLFINPNSGSAYRPKRLAEIWNQYSGSDASLYEATRHSFATQLVEDKVPLPTVKMLMRHSDIRTTQRYIHPTDETALEAVNLRGRKKLYLLREQKESRKTDGE